MRDNCPAHKAKTTLAKLNDFRWKLLDHPPYSPDLSPLDFYLFRNLKSELFRTRFVDQNHCETAVRAYFEQKSLKWFRRGVDMFREQLAEVLSTRGEYTS